MNFLPHVRFQSFRVRSIQQLCPRMPYFRDDKTKNTSSCTHTQQAAIWKNKQSALGIGLAIVSTANTLSINLDYYWTDLKHSMHESICNRIKRSVYTKCEQPVRRQKNQSMRINCSKVDSSLHTNRVNYSRIECVTTSNFMVLLCLCFVWVNVIYMVFIVV